MLQAAPTNLSQYWIVPSQLDFNAGQT